MTISCQPCANTVPAATTLSPQRNALYLNKKRYMSRSEMKSESVSYIQTLCKTIRFQAISIISVPEALAYLKENSDELNQIGPGMIPDKCEELMDYYEKEIRQSPIRRCDVEAEESESMAMLESLKVHRDWTCDEQEQMLMIWKLFQRDREALMNELIHLWNICRQKFMRYNQTVPFSEGSLGVLDTRLHHRMKQVDKFFALGLTIAFLEASNQSIPSTWQNTYQKVLNGFKMKNPAVDENTISKALEDLFINRNGSNIPKVEKKRVTVTTGMDVGDVSDYIHSRMHLLSEFAFISPSLPAVAIPRHEEGMVLEPFPTWTDQLPTEDLHDLDTEESDSTFEEFLNMDEMEKKHVPSNWLS
jgi:hypothetical protein